MAHRFPTSAPTHWSAGAAPPPPPAAGGRGSGTPLPDPPVGQGMLGSRLCRDRPRLDTTSPRLRSRSGERRVGKEGRVGWWGCKGRGEGVVVGGGDWGSGSRRRLGQGKWR